MSENKISLMIVDDHQLVRQGIESFLGAQENIEIVASVANGMDAITQSIEKLPDVILMDLNLGQGINGIQATQSIKDHCPNTQIIVLTSYHSDEYIFPAIKAGALSYVLKDIHPQDLYQAVKKAANRESTLSPSVANRIIDEMQNKSANEKQKLSESSQKLNSLNQLSVRELQILKMIGSGNNNQEIAESLNIAIKTVRCHVSNILSKLHLRDRTQAAIHAWQTGMVEQNK